MFVFNFCAQYWSDAVHRVQCAALGSARSGACLREARPRQTASSARRRSRRISQRDGSLYGNNFRAASTDVVSAAFTVVDSLDAAPRANIIAMASRRGRRGAYTAADIRNLLETCVAAFTGAMHMLDDAKQLAGVHTGFWGVRCPRCVALFVVATRQNSLCFVRRCARAVRRVWRTSHHEPLGPARCRQHCRRGLRHGARRRQERRRELCRRVKGSRRAQLALGARSLDAASCGSRRLPPSASLS